MTASGFFDRIASRSGLAAGFNPNGNLAGRRRPGAQTCGNRTRRSQALISRS